MLSRREFLKHCRNISVAAFGSQIFAAEIAEGFTKLKASSKPQIMFIQSQCCTGCSISLTYGNDTNFVDFLTTFVRLQAHPNLSFSQGHDYMETIHKMIDEGGYFLVFEGSIPMGIKEACMFDDVPMAEFAKKVMSKAAAVVANGTCASYGGIPASNMNVTGAVSVDKYMKDNGIKTPLIKIPGCPIQPDRLMGPVAYIVATGKLPPLKDGKPKKYYNDIIHNQCGRYQAFNQGHYTHDLDKEKEYCLLKKGCRGPITHSDCPTRRWNGRVSVCIESNAPCIGCIHDNFPFNSQLYLSDSSFQDMSWEEMKKSYRR